MQYAGSVQQVLIRKINKTEQELIQLKLDYCRFVFGLSHRSLVECNGRRYRVRGVDIHTMKSLDEGGLSAPAVSGVPVDGPADAAPVCLGQDWTLCGARSLGAAPQTSA